MLIELTYACSMGCTHCLSSCKPDGEHMSMNTLKDALDFAEKNRVKALVFSGGEMYENPDIEDMLDYIANYCIRRDIPMSLTTNGRILSSDVERLEHLKSIRDRVGKKRFLLQVTDDEKFYPTRLDKKQVYRLEKLGAVVEGVPHDSGNPKRCLYPQGRALENFSEEYWNTKAPKCCNCRMIVKQKPSITFSGLNDTLFSFSKVCVPSIAPNGDIKIGESAHCPAVASIYDSSEDIIKGIRNCKCHACTISEDIMKKNSPLEWSIFSM